MKLIVQAKIEHHTATSCGYEFVFAVADGGARLIAKAEGDYLPSGPPMSPLTTSFFTCWAFFDACVGVARETLGTTAMAVGTAFGMHDELVRVIGLMQDSHMAVYAHEGIDNDCAVLRELVTNRVCRALCPSGYSGRAGELWYARALPPPAPGLEEHVVFTTPYVLIEPGEREWMSYFQRTLPEAPPDARLAAYERHMKFGPARDYWTEFVFEAYFNHRHGVIFLEGHANCRTPRKHRIQVAQDGPARRRLKAKFCSVNTSEWFTAGCSRRGMP